MLERTNARALTPADAALRARPRRRRRLVHLADEGAAGGAGAASPPRFDVLAMVKPQFEVGRGASARAASSAIRRSAGAAARRGRATARRELGACGARLRLVAGCPGPKGNRETFVWLAEAGPPGRRRRRPGRRGARGRGRRMSAPRAPSPCSPTRARSRSRRSLAQLDRTAARERGVDAALRRRRRRDKHGLDGRATGLVVTDAQLATTSSCASCSAATARSCARCAATRAPSVPVFAVNFGEVGFLATVDPEELDAAASRGVRRRVRGPARCPRSRCATARASCIARSTTSRSTARSASASRSSPTASTARRSARCAATAWSSATPAGSTGYNLANGGPVLAWGVEGFVVSFIAPHSLTARALVVAPDDELTVSNRGREAVDVLVDGAPGRRARARRGHHTPASCRDADGARAGARARRSTGGCARSSGACS